MHWNDNCQIQDGVPLMEARERMKYGGRHSGHCFCFALFLFQNSEALQARMISLGDDHTGVRDIFVINGINLELDAHDTKN